jgi:uncharacterized protein (TIGR04255 family)
MNPLPGSLPRVSTQSPPLLEATLHLRFDPVPLPPERLQYFVSSHHDLFSNSITGGLDEFVLESIDHLTILIVASGRIELSSTQGHSYPRLRQMWTRILDSLLDILGITGFTRVALSYVNEIPLQELKSFRDYLNTGFEMPSSLKERLALFRSEFRFRSEPEEIRVWIQPEWDDKTEGYSVQLIFESMRMEHVAVADLPVVVQSLHYGIKDVFHQIVSQDYIRQLPQ